jgi:sugar phosphate isomerase/epimerase
MSASGPRQPVTYCTNIHRGESWADMRSALAAHTLAVKAALCPDRPFPVGLRVSGLAARELVPGASGPAAPSRAVSAPGASGAGITGPRGASRRAAAPPPSDEALRFKDWLDENGLYVATVNGFPYGTFHGRPVKSAVYRPDWRDPERLAYTLRLASLLAAWLPEGMDGSISTVPVGFAAGFDPSEELLALANIRRALEAFADLAQRTGKLIRLSVEPEPGCLIETTPGLVRLFDRLALPDALRIHLAACFDCCHQALQFEDPAASLALLADNAIPIGHVQVSSALHLDGPDLSRLARFDEPVYLHQCVARRGDGSLARFDDLGQALAASASGALGGVECWRVHFHVPVFLESLPECLSTQAFLRDFLAAAPLKTPLEVETYTFDVLPPELKTPDVADSIIREIGWVKERLAARERRKKGSSGFSVGSLAHELTG